MFLFTDRVAKEPAPSPQQAATPHAATLRQASAATGVSFDYLARTAERESNFNPSARASTSSATGMFQFLEQTWLGMVKQEGPKFGLATEAAAIMGNGGRYSVGDPAMRQRILALREDPTISATMAGAFASRNGRQLEESLGRKPKEGELYIAHFLGPPARATSSASPSRAQAPKRPPISTMPPRPTAPSSTTAPAAPGAPPRSMPT